MRFTCFVLAACLAALALPSPASAWWYRPVFVGPRVVVVPPPPVLVAPPPVAYPVRRPPLVWVPPHFNRWGVWVRGHWA